jgi:hypothetical protein
MHAESVWDSKSKAVDEKLDPLEEENGRVMRAMELDIQSLINEQENIKVCSVCLVTCSFSIVSHQFHGVQVVIECYYLTKLHNFLLLV